MTTLWKLAIKKNSTELMKDMEVLEMMPYLYENNILTDHQQDDIQNATGRETRGKILLGYILRKDPALDPFGHLLHALQSTNQNHLAQGLINSYNWLEQEGYGNMDIPEEILNDPCICSFESVSLLYGQQRVSCNCSFVIKTIKMALKCIQFPFKFLLAFLFSLFTPKREDMSKPRVMYTSRNSTYNPFQILRLFFYYIILEAYDHLIVPLVSGSNSERLVFLLHLVGYNLAYIYVLNLAYIYVLVIMPPTALFICIIITLLIYISAYRSTRRTSTRTHGQNPETSRRFIFHLHSFTLLVLVTCGSFVTIPQVLKYISVTSLFPAITLMMLHIMVGLILTLFPTFSLSIMNICSLVCVGVEYGYFFNKSLFFSSYPLLHIILCSILVSVIVGSLHMYVSLRHLRSIFTYDVFDQNFWQFFERFLFFVLVLLVYTYVWWH